MNSQMVRADEITVSGGWLTFDFYAGTATKQRLPHLSRFERCAFQVRGSWEFVSSASPALTWLPC